MGQCEVELRDGTPLVLTLRPYQAAALEAVAAAVARGLRRVVVSHATGLGKTVLAAELIRRRLPARALFVAHREELLTQALEKLRMLVPAGDLGLVRGEADAAGRRVIVASVATVARPARLARVLEAGPFETVVVDEAHHGTADSYRAILEGVGAFEARGPFVLGLTATPYRSSGEPLAEVFEAIAHEVSILAGIRGGHLVDVRAQRVRLDVDFGFHVRQGDYVVGEVEEAMLEGDAPGVVARAYVEHASRRKGIVFTPTIRLAHETAEALRGVGIKAEAVSGETPAEERRDILRRFRSGELRAVCNAATLTEGYDEPSADLVVIARPTRSKILFTQMVGRGTRPYPGKADVLVLDVVGSTYRHDLVTTAGLFDVTERELASRTVLEALEAREQQEAVQQRLDVDRARLRAEAVDLFARRRFAWTEAGGVYSLSLGDGLLLLRREAPGADRWDVLEVRREKQSGQVWPQDVVMLLESGLSLAYAQGTAEDLVRSRGAARLNDRSAPWRKAPATDKQRECLERWRLWRPGMSKGEASDLMGARFAEKAARSAARQEVSNAR